MLDATTAVIDTLADLSTAVSGDNGVDYIYLDENITMTSGIRVHPAKTSLAIDGHYPPESAVFHTHADAGNGGEIYINTSARAFYFIAQIPFVFVGNQVNRWDTPKAISVAGTFEDEPQYKWKRPRYGSFRMKGRADNSQTYVDSHSFTQEELDQMSPLNDLKLRESVAFSEGNLPLLVNRIVIGMRPITGRTAQKARVRVSPVAGGPYPDSNADDSGIFSSVPTTPVPPAEVFTITSNTPFLLTSMAAESQEEGLLIIVGTEFVPVHTDGLYLDVDETPITWDSNRGVLARLTVPMRSGKRYSTQLSWAFYPTGVQLNPEGRN